jgi:hypothetical protein
MSGIDKNTSLQELAVLVSRTLQAGGVTATSPEAAP